MGVRNVITEHVHCILHCKIRLRKYNHDDHGHFFECETEWCYYTEEETYGLEFCESGYLVCPDCFKESLCIKSGKLIPRHRFLIDSYHPVPEIPKAQVGQVKWI